MAANNNLTTLNGMFKEVYADRIKDIIPEGVKLLKSIPFVSKDKQNGADYHQPVVLGMEHGASFATDGDAFALEAPISGAVKDAKLSGTQMVLRSYLSYTAASRALAGGASAFESSTKFLVGNMLRSISRKLEIELLYGNGTDAPTLDGLGYGTVSAVNSNTMTIRTSSWSPGIWAGSEGLKIDIRTGYDGATRGNAVVVSVDMAARTVTVDSMPGSVADGDAVYHYGAFEKEFNGIHKMLVNTGTLWNLSASTYNLWKGNEVDAGTARLTFATINKAVARCVEKGQDGPLVLHVNPRTWGNLLEDQAALRKYDSSYKASVAETGSETIKFHSQNGVIEIISNNFVKEGYAYMLSMDDMIRVGSSDVTFKRPGQGDEFFKDMENAAGFELRSFTDQAVFCAAPGKCALIYGIVNA